MFAPSISATAMSVSITADPSRFPATASRG